MFTAFMLNYKKREKRADEKAEQQPEERKLETPEVLEEHPDPLPKRWAVIPQSDEPPVVFKPPRPERKDLEKKG